MKQKWIGPDGWIVGGKVLKAGDLVKLSPDDLKFFSQLGYVEPANADLNQIAREEEGVK